jgi:hypothetical protein
MTTATSPEPQQASTDRQLTARVLGPKPIFDARQCIATREVTDIALATRVAASRYTAPLAMTCRAPRTAMRAGCGGSATAVSELLWGETFDLFDSVDGWAFGRSAHDGYTGWVSLAALADADTALVGTMVTARVAPVFTQADIKTPVVAELPLGARINGRDGDRFFAITGGGFVHHRHLAPLPQSPLAVARRFTGAPYLWGGRTPMGVDCSGLVQAALRACGRLCPRDSDQQRDALGTPVAFADRRGGDLVFFPGHVGILVDADTLFHANAHWMVTLAEPLADVTARLHAAGSAEAITGLRRLTDPI